MNASTLPLRTTARFCAVLHPTMRSKESVGLAKFQRIATIGFVVLLNACANDHSRLTEQSLPASQFPPIAIPSMTPLEVEVPLYVASESGDGRWHRLTEVDTEPPFDPYENYRNSFCGYLVGFKEPQWVLTATSTPEYSPLDDLIEYYNGVPRKSATVYYHFTLREPGAR